MLPTRSERIADLTQALERHKALAVLMTSWTKTDELIIEKSVHNLRQTRLAISEVERQQAEVEAALAKLLEAEHDELFAAPAKLESQPPPTCAECWGSGIVRVLGAGGDYEDWPCQSLFHSTPVGTDAAPEPPQTNQQ